MAESRADTATALIGLDHVALRVADTEALARFLCGHCGMQRVEREGFSVLGPAGARTRLVLYQAEEPPDPGVLQRVVLRVSDLERAVSELPDGLDVQRVAPELVVFAGPEGLELGLTWALGGVDYELDHLVLGVTDPDETLIALAELGFVPRGGALDVGDKHVRLQPGVGSGGEGGVLAHLGVLVESAAAVRSQASRAGLEIDTTNAHPDKLRVYVRGPERIRIEYTGRT